MQVWGTNSAGGYMYTDELSDVLRMAMQPLMRFRQHSFVEDAKGKNAGELFHWNIYSDVADDGAELDELVAMPETNFVISQGQLTITERGNSVPFTCKLDDLSRQPVTAVINKVLKNDANKTMERAAHAQFNSTLLTITPASGTSATAITVEVTGTPTATNNIALGNSHVKLIVDEFKEREIPVFDGANYGCIGRPSTFRALKDDLEPISQYSERGFGHILNGEIGRSYDGVRFFEETVIPSEGWSNAKSDAAWFFGDDTVAEGIAIIEEMRGKIPTDFGRSRGIAWYALNGFGIVHNQTGAEQNRIAKWDSAA